MQLLRESTGASALRQSQGGEDRWAFLSSHWLIIVLGKFSLSSWPICSWGLCILIKLGMGLTLTPMMKVVLWEGSRSWGHCHGPAACPGSQAPYRHQILLPASKQLPHCSVC